MDVCLRGWMMNKGCASLPRAAHAAAAQPRISRMVGDVANQPGVHKPRGAKRFKQVLSDA